MFIPKLWQAHEEWETAFENADLKAADSVWSHREDVIGIDPMGFKAVGWKEVRKNLSLGFALLGPSQMVTWDVVVSLAGEKGSVNGKYILEGVFLNQTFKATVRSEIIIPFSSGDVPINAWHSVLIKYASCCDFAVKYRYCFFIIDTSSLAEIVGTLPQTFTVTYHHLHNGDGISPSICLPISPISKALFQRLISSILPLKPFPIIKGLSESGIGILVSFLDIG